MACGEASDQRTDGDGIATRDLMGSAVDEPMSRRVRSESAPKESAFSREDERESDSDYEDDMDAAETGLFISLLMLLVWPIWLTPRVVERLDNGQP